MLNFNLVYVWQKLQNVDHIYSGKGDTGAAISVVQFNICNDYNYYNLAERKKKNFDFFSVNTNPKPPYATTLVRWCEREAL